MNHQMGSTAVVRVNPAVDTAAHTAGDVIAAFNIAPIDGLTGGGVLKQIAVFDDAGQAGAMTFLFFDGALTGTYAANGAPAPSTADKAKLLGAVVFAAGDWTTAGGDSYGCKECALALRHTPSQAAAPGRTAAGALTVVILAGGTQDYAAATDLQIAFGILPDGA